MASNRRAFLAAGAVGALAAAPAANRHPSDPDTALAALLAGNRRYARGHAHHAQRRRDRRWTRRSSARSSTASRNWASAGPGARPRALRGDRGHPRPSAHRRPGPGHLELLVDEITPSARRTRALPGNWSEHTMTTHTRWVRDAIRADPAFREAQVAAARFDPDTGLVSLLP